METPDHRNNEMSRAGRIFVFFLSALLAGWISKKILQRYPRWDIMRVGKKVLGFLLLWGVLVFALLSIAVLATIIYQLFQ